MLKGIWKIRSHLHKVIETHCATTIETLINHSLNTNLLMFYNF